MSAESTKRELQLSQEQPNNPLHGITLEQIVTSLVEHCGWREMGFRINIRCFTSDPSVKSSLKFLRKTEWAREKVEELYLEMRRRGVIPAPPSGPRRRRP